MAKSNAMVPSKYRSEAKFSRIVLLCCSIMLLAILNNAVVLAQDATSEQRNVGGNEYRPCVDGPQMLRATDEWERQNRKKALVTINGKSMSSETAAELFISDCSQQLAVLTGMAASEEGTVFRMVSNAWNANLEFMKWWLQNRRQKVGPPTVEK
jgi:hypothetical protein